MPAAVVKFGDGFELNRSSYELPRAGRALKLERIPLDILFLLVERRGQLVAREDIIGRIWGKDVFLDTDSSINGAIRKIRQVLKDDPENPVFVQTVTGKGYRFIAVVTEAEVSAPEGSGKKLESSPPIILEESAGLARRQARRVSRASFRWIASLTILLVVVVLAAGIYRFHTRSSLQSAAIQGRESVAKLGSS